LWVARGGQTCKSKQKSRLSAWLLELKRPLDLRKMDQAGMNVVRLETAAEAAIILMFSSIARNPCSKIFF